MKFKSIIDNDPEMMEYVDFDDFDIRHEGFIVLEDIFLEFGEVFFPCNSSDRDGKGMCQAAILSLTHKSDSYFWISKVTVVLGSIPFHS